MAGSEVGSRKERRTISVSGDGKVIYFIPALIVLAKLGHKPAIKKLDEILEWLHGVSNIF